MTEYWEVTVWDVRQLARPLEVGVTSFLTVAEAEQHAGRLRATLAPSPFTRVTVTPRLRRSNTPPRE